MRGRIRAGRVELRARDARGIREAMKTAATVLSLARRIVASVSLLSLGACFREVARVDQSFAVTPLSHGVRIIDGAVDDASCALGCAYHATGRCQ